ncbi:MAG: hypothetical protein RIS08_339 [Actinomycetota bacterium]|jgi:hypothetical protein
MSNRGDIANLRRVLFTGGSTFGLSALWLLFAPEFFAELLGLDQSQDLTWSLRMIAITLVALTGNMLAHAKFGSDRAVVWASRVMLLSAFALGVLTLLIPVAITWFTVSYAAVGFSFAAAYAFFLFRPSRG